MISAKQLVLLYFYLKWLNLTHNFQTLEVFCWRPDGEVGEPWSCSSEAMVVYWWNLVGIYTFTVGVELRVTYILYLFTISM